VYCLVDASRVSHKGADILSDSPRKKDEGVKRKLNSSFPSYMPSSYTSLSYTARIAPQFCSRLQSKREAGSYK